MKNTNKEILKKIKNTILEIANELNIKVDNIILFGSRARGDAKEDSDLDLLIITKKVDTHKTRRNFESRFMKLCLNYLNQNLHF